MIIIRRHMFIPGLCVSEQIKVINSKNRKRKLVTIAIYWIEIMQTKIEKPFTIGVQIILNYILFRVFS